MRRITIGTKVLQLKYNMGAVLAYERNSGRPFLLSDCAMTSVRLEIAYHAFKHKNPDWEQDTKFEDWVETLTDDQVQAIDEALLAEMHDFYPALKLSSDEQKKESSPNE